MRAPSLLPTLSLALALAACEAAGGGAAASADTSALELAGYDASADVALDAANPQGCPAAEPSPNGACSGSDTCSYGQECCCGECSASFVCTCAGGTWACYYTDFCLRPGCPDVVSGDVAADAAPDATSDDTVDAALPDGAPPSDGGGEVGAACPTEVPLGVQGVQCQAGQRCEYGQECCCGACAPATVCECWDGAWGCHATDFCMIPGCPDEPPPEGACRTGADCDPMASCRRPDDPTPCGICRHPGYDFGPATCQADGDCEAGLVCEAVQPPTMCLCEPASVCLPACGAEAPCPIGQACAAGHCVAATCASDADCPTLFGCDPAGGTCARLACGLDADCGPGHCVEGRCYDKFGVCQLPVP